MASEDSASPKKEEEMLLIRSEWEWCWRLDAPVRDTDTIDDDAAAAAADTWKGSKGSKASDGMRILNPVLCQQLDERSTPSGNEDVMMSAPHRITRTICGFDSWSLGGRHCGG